VKLNISDKGWVTYATLKYCWDSVRISECCTSVEYSTQLFTGKLRTPYNILMYDVLTDSFV
jgi:hypothetical protein